MASIPPIAKVYPGNLIRLFKLPDTDTSYRNVKRFTTVQERDSYFASVDNFSILNAKVIRLPNSLRVPYRAEWVRQFNYMSFDNHMSYAQSEQVTNSGSDGGSPDGETIYNNRIYAFITSVEWVNIQCCDVYYTVDVFTTYFWHLKPLHSFISRSHLFQGAGEKLGDNILPEPVNVTEHKSFTQDLNDITSIGIGEGACIIIAAGQNSGSNIGSVQGQFVSGVYSGFELHAFKTAEEANAFLDGKNTESVYSVYQVDSFLGKLAETPSLPSAGIVFTLNNSEWLTSIDGYSPKNKKCFQYPYNYLELFTPNGQKLVLKYELFDSSDTNNGERTDFWALGQCGISPAVLIKPIAYAGQPRDEYRISYDNENSILLDNYPVCTYGGDALTNLIYSGAIFNMLGAPISGAVTGAATSGGNPVGAAIGGVSSLVSSLLSFPAAMATPDTINGTPSGNMATALNIQKIWVKHAYAHNEDIKAIDDFFEQFGYTSNLLDVPNFNIRPYWCYYEIPDFNCVWIRDDFCVPNDAINEIKKALKNGVTFWDKDTHFGDYSKDNHTS